MGTNIIFWIGFHLFIFTMLALDLGVFHKKAHRIPVREAVIWTIVWISLAMIFNLIIFFKFGSVKALEFLTGYVVEYSLSIDNIFVIILIFTSFGVKSEYQHKVLFWGIMGALIMRGIFIFAGVALITRFHWVVIVFGGFLVFTGIKMLFTKQEEIEPEKNSIVRFFRAYFPVSQSYHGQKLFIKENGKMLATPLFIVLLIIESSDLIFAVDSIPAILAISQDRLIVYTSNIFAILGLRSLYFAISGVMGFFRYIKTGLAFVLTFVGVKMLLAYFHFEIPILMSLLVIISILVISILASVFIKAKSPEIS